MLMPIYSPHNPNVATITFTANVDSTTASTAVRTFSSTAIGTAADNRVIIVSIGTTGGGGGTDDCTSVTVGGTGLSKLISVLHTDHTIAQIWAGSITSGTSADIVVTWARAANRTGISVWAAYNIGTPEDSGSASISSSASAMSTNLDISAGGVAIGYTFTNGGTGKSFTWSNLTENFDENIDDTGNYSGAAAAFAAAQSGLTVSSTPNASIPLGTTVFAAWPPAGAGVPAYITLEADDWQGDTGSATLGSGSILMTAGDKNIRTADDFIPAGVDFDFEMLMGNIGTNVDIRLGVCDNGTNTGAGTPTTTNPVLWATSNIGVGTWGWRQGNNVEDTGGNETDRDWMSENVIGFSRRGSQIYGMLNGSVRHTFASSGTSTSKAMKFFAGSAGGGAWPAGATNARYRRGGGLPTLS